MGGGGGVVVRVLRIQSARMIVGNRVTCPKNLIAQKYPLRKVKSLSLKEIRRSLLAYQYRKYPSGVSTPRKYPYRWSRSI